MSFAARPAVRTRSRTTPRVLPIYSFLVPLERSSSRAQIRRPDFERVVLRGQAQFLASSGRAPRPRRTAFFRSCASFLTFRSTLVVLLHARHAYPDREASFVFSTPWAWVVTRPGPARSGDGLRTNAPSTGATIIESSTFAQKGELLASSRRLHQDPAPGITVATARSKGAPNRASPAPIRPPQAPVAVFIQSREEPPPRVKSPSSGS